MKSEKENRDTENLAKNRLSVQSIKEQEKRQKVTKIAQKKEREILSKINQNTRNKEENVRYNSSKVVIVILIKRIMTLNRKIFRIWEILNMNFFKN